MAGPDPAIQHRAAPLPQRALRARGAGEGAPLGRKGDNRPAANLLRIALVGRSWD